jgi:prepilin-type N-terminal cleavage/methylation domain-containing protein
MFKVNTTKKTWIHVATRMTDKKRAFTLIEMMVAVSIFAIVVMISMTAILSVVDSNKKAQSLKSVMNNLNFALETMTRSIKTGSGLSVGGDYVQTTDQKPVLVKYSLGTGDYEGRIMRTVGVSGTPEPITAPEVEIDNLKFIDGKDDGQPSVVMIVQGTVKMSERVSSDFSIQTTITQRLPGV